MPVFNLRCSACAHPRKAIRPPGWRFDTDPWLYCSSCGAKGAFVREVRPPTVIVKELLDDGARVKSVERLADAERLHKERLEIENAIAKGKAPDKTVV